MEYRLKQFGTSLFNCLVASNAPHATLAQLHIRNTMQNISHRCNLLFRKNMKTTN